jgi:hypothetical protein
MTNIRKTILMTALSIGALSAEAGDNLEAITNGGMVIRNRVWANSAMPLDWALNDQGAINNNSVGAGTPNIPIADLRAEVQAAFMSWQAVANSDLTLSNLPDTATFDIGCDLENIVTWADTTVAFPATTIARGVTTVYVGAPIVLDSMNRTVVCSDGSMAPPNVTLPAADYPDGVTLQPGTILDMDMVWNAVNFDYVLTPNATASVFDVLSVATHEFGHLFGLSHSSMAFTGVDRTTMFPFASSTDVAAQIEQASLEADDERSSAKDYPGTGAFPNGVAPFTTGAIAGRVTMPNGAAVQGARIWFYSIADTSQPVYETFTATQFDADLAAGEYALEAVAPGNYYACIVPWSNGAPPGGADNPARYNASTNNGVNHTAAAGWATECFPDFATGAAAPDFDETDPIQTIAVAAGATTPNINFVTGSQQADFALVFDVSGSMNLPSGGGDTKIEALRDAADAFVDFLDLTGGHRVGMTTFSTAAGDTNPVFGMQAINAGSIANAGLAVANLTAGGMTNIVAGVQQGVSQLTGLATPNPRQVLLLFSDGRHNWPFGSDLNAISSPIVSNDIVLHSIGFGADLSSAVLADVALASGGTHVEDPSLSPLELQKHFLAIAASAADDVLFVDPRKTLAAGETNSVSFATTTSDSKLDIASLWLGDGQNRIMTSLRTPSGCTIDLSSPSPGVDTRSGENHLLARISLPLICKTKSDRAGVWRVDARNVSGGTEQSDVIVFGKSPVRLVASIRGLNGRPVIEARVFNGVDPVKGAKIFAQIIAPAPARTNSEEEDRRGSETRPAPPVRGVPERGVLMKQPAILSKLAALRVDLNDRGERGDLKARDGVHTAVIEAAKPGVYQARIVMTDAKGVAREATTSFYVGEKGVVAPTGDSGRTLLE